ncbi:MAG: DUF3662 domain-containing protein [Thermoleophilia bacterium]|nr:DUF3662 domain-containing protein [Thermoleophilia bacterium]
MSILRSIEERLARIVEGGFGRAFRTSVQPEEIARRLVREMDGGQRRTMRQVFVPNVYDVYLSPADHAQFEGSERALTGELTEFLAQHARQRGYALATRPRVKLHVDEDLAVGTFGIASQLDEDAAQAAREANAPVPVPSQSTSVQPVVAPPTVIVAPPVVIEQLVITGATNGPCHLGSQTVRIGRGKANGIVVDDASVSREHAEISPGKLGGYVVRDLDSTNGIMHNGSRVREHLIVPGDTLKLGTAELKVERAAEADQ